MGLLLHGGIAAIDQHLGDHGDRLALNAAAQKFVVQGLLDHVANGSLGIRAARVERHGMHHAARVFRAQEDKADLRAVAVRDDDIPALGYHLGNVDGGFANSIKLIGNALMSFVFDERVATNGNNGQFTHFASRKNGSTA